ncbi:hypothetical protein E2C01_078001 [Portunus trituberculatus]|uniref:Uncharacterized protein n=1 Tax=Portunus trituberculatus TaxID=210409 RepID=A0A5B7ISY7_PORTR|nr:hypothetical protein [Portunus trituberculatus]
MASTYLCLQLVYVEFSQFGVRGISKRTGSNPVHGPSIGWAFLIRGSGFLAGGL